jgi:hypothetical protein
VDPIKVTRASGIGCCCATEAAISIRFICTGIRLRWRRLGEGLSGLRKDVINVMPLQTVAVDFVADNPGDTLLHCHQQLHMDFGFMTIIKYRRSIANGTARHATRNRA